MEDSQEYDLTKQEFFGLMMIYAANIDGHESVEEINMIRNSVGEAAFVRSYAVYEEMNDYDLINYFRDHKDKYFKSKMDEKIFLSEIKSFIAVDHHIDIMESALLLAFKKILNEE